jgi:hypothetical protein
MEDTNHIKAEILAKLVRRNCWKGKHTSFDNLQKSFPKHLRGDIKDAANELIKEGFILKKPTGYGLEVSLNSLKTGEIMQIVEKSYKEK